MSNTALSFETSHLVYCQILMSQKCFSRDLNKYYMKLTNPDTRLKTSFSFIHVSFFQFTIVFLMAIHFLNTIYIVQLASLCCRLHCPYNKYLCNTQHNIRILFRLTFYEKAVIFLHSCYTGKLP